MDDTRWILNLLQDGIVCGPADFLDYIKKDAIIMRLIDDKQTQTEMSMVVEIAQAKCIFKHMAASGERKDPEFMGSSTEPKDNLLLARIYNDDWEKESHGNIHYMPLFDLCEHLGVGRINGDIQLAPVYCMVLRLRKTCRREPDLSPMRQLDRDHSVVY